MQRSRRVHKAARRAAAEYRDEPNENAGQFAVITAIKAVRDYFEREDLSKWSKKRRESWHDDLEPIAAAFEQMFPNERSGR